MARFLSSKPNDDVIRFGRSTLRWVGGKSHLLPEIVPFLPRVYRRYIEPMIGGGALFFGLAPRQAILSDINTELMNFYRVLKNNGSGLTDKLMKLRASRRLYYKFRHWTPKSDLQRAVRFAYLNRLSWNGLYRVNRHGVFNVPIGDRLPEILWIREELNRASFALRGAKLIHGDFEAILRLAKQDDFVFLDPPYPRGAREPLGFNRYAVKRFGVDDHRRLATWIGKLSTRGVKVMLTMVADSQLPRLYSGLHGHVVLSRSLIASNGSDRKQVRELILTNYNS